MPSWPTLEYDSWTECRDTLHALTQLLGKLAVAVAPPEPELQHAALRLTARGWETAPLPAPNGSGAIVALLDLRTHLARVEHSDGESYETSLAARPVADITADVVGAFTRMGGAVEINFEPQEVAWSAKLDEDLEHHSYNPEQAGTYFAAATQAALVLAAFRAPFRGRVTPVNAWWGSFDLAVNLFSGLPAQPPSEDFIMRNAMDAQEVAVGWWPGDSKYPHAAFYAYAHPAPANYGVAELRPKQARWEANLGEFVFDWNDVVNSDDPHAAALSFAQSAFTHSCEACDWRPELAASIAGSPPPVR